MPFRNLKYSYEVLSYGPSVKNLPRHTWQVDGEHGKVKFMAGLQADKEEMWLCRLEFLPNSSYVMKTGRINTFPEGNELYTKDLLAENLWVDIKRHLASSNHDMVFYMLEREYENHFKATL